MKARSCITALAMAAYVTLTAAAVQAETRLKLGQALAPTSLYGVAADAFAAKVAKGTDGRYIVEHYASGSLGGERELVEGAQIGTVDIVITSTGPVGNFVPEIELFNAPFLFRDYAHAHAVFDGPIGQEALQKFTEKGLIGLAWGEAGFRHLTNSIRPVQSPADMEGIKVRTMENPIHTKAFSQLGALPTPMAFPELFTALQQGTVDGQETPISVILSSNFQQVQKYLTLTGHVYTPVVILMSKIAWDDLSEDDRQVFADAARTAARVMREQNADAEKSGIATLEAAGMTVTEVDTDAFSSLMGPVYEDLAERFGQETVDRIRNYGK